MTLPKLMSGVQLLRHGGPDAQIWNDAIPVRSLLPNEVVVRVSAAGVNNTDINTRIGWYSGGVTQSTANTDDTDDIEAGGWSGQLPFPLIQGGDLCGEIVEVGHDAGAFTVGMRVTCQTNQPIPTPDQPTSFECLGSELNGAFAQYCTLPADRLFDVSNSALSDIDIAAMPCAYGTAYNLLHRAGVTDKDTVLVTGASGGVGMAAVQLARLRGASVTGITNAAKRQAVLDAGADAVLLRDQIPPPDSFTVVLDVVGGDGFQSILDALKPGGRYATSGAIAGPIVTADLRSIYLRDISLFGCSYQPREVFAELIEIINAGSIRPLVSGVYPLEDIAKAQQDFLSKKFPGKLVLIPPN